MTANSRNAIRSLASKPAPVTTPATSHSRSLPVRRMRRISHDASAQAGRSNVVVLSRWPAPMTSGPAATQIAASAWATRSAPSSRAISPVSSTRAADATADGSLSTISDAGARSDISRASSGTSGGWSG